MDLIKIIKNPTRSAWKASKMVASFGKNVYFSCLFRLRYPSVEIVKQAQRSFYSQGGQDAYIVALLFRCLDSCETRRVVVDVGCNHPIIYSNTFVFEKYFNCHTIAVDPLEKFKKSWSAIRPTASFAVSAVGEIVGVADLFVPVAPSNKVGTTDHTDMFATLEGDGKKFLKDQEFERFQVPVNTLSNILDQFDVNNVLYCSIDTEGNELSVLRGIDFNRHHIYCFSIENNNKNEFGDDRIRKLMVGKGYRFVARIWGLDDIFVREDLFTIAGSLAYRAPCKRNGQNLHK